MNRIHAIVYSVFAVVVLLLVLALVGVIPLPRKGEPVPAPTAKQEPEPKPTEANAPEPKRPEPPGVRRVALPEDFESATGQKYFYYTYSGGRVDAWIEVESLGTTTEAVRLTGESFWLEPKTDSAALGGTILWAPGAAQGEFVLSLSDPPADGQGGTTTQTERKNGIAPAIAKLLPPSTEKRNPGDAPAGTYHSGRGGSWALEPGKPITLREYWAYEKDVKTYTVRLRCQLAPPPKPKP